MACNQVSVAVLLAIVVTASGQRAAPWSEPDNVWIQSVNALGGDITLYCNVTGEPVWAQNSSITTWMLNNLTIMTPRYSDGKHQMSSNLLSLTIVNVQRNDLGLYHCIRQRTNTEPWMLKRGLNLRGPYFENLWEKYRTNTIIGISACLGFVAFMVMVCMTYHFRWPRLSKDPLHLAPPSATYDNHAYMVSKEPNSIEVHVPTKEPAATVDEKGTAVTML